MISLSFSISCIITPAHNKSLLRFVYTSQILSHHYEPEFGSPKKPLFPEAEALHYLDVLDARMFDMQDALVSTLPGTFSERVWALDNRKLYKPNEGEEDKC